MFQLSGTSIDTAQNDLENPSAGAIVSFEGWVRNHNEGKDVKSLEYEAYPQLANKEGNRILTEAKKKFEILDCYCEHRTGYLQIGEVAVVVHVTAQHREAAFDACRYIIDEVKSRVPIWKKEHYVDGDSCWVRCEHCAGHKH